MVVHYLGQENVGQAVVGVLVVAPVAVLAKTLFALRESLPPRPPFVDRGLGVEAAIVVVVVN